jgi:hypothetical protein
MKQIHFFATCEDLVPVLEAVERTASIKYVRMGQEKTRDLRVYSQGSMIPSLGRATSGSAITSDKYLVVSKDRSVQTELIRMHDGGVQYAVDQLENPHSVTFSSGGLWTDDIVLHGRVATVSDMAEAQALIRRFAKEIRKAFRKVKAFWVGDHAHALLRAGKRLTISDQSPREFDLVEDGQSPHTVRA